MNFSGMTAGEIVAHVYSAFEPAPMWDADRLRGLNTDSLPRLYCPDCRNHGTIQLGSSYDPPKRNTENGDAHESQKKTWYCSACKSWHRRPLVLRAKGGIGGTESRSSRDNDYRIVDGIEAGKVMAAVESLPNPARCWSMWAHTQHGTAQMQNDIVWHALIELDKRGQEKPRTYQDGRNALVLAVMISEDSRERARNGRARYDDASLSASISVNQSQFASDRLWGRLRAGLIEIYDALELDMSRAVIAAIREPISETA